MAIRIRPTGARAWKAIDSRHGRTRWLHLGDASAIGLADARQLAAEAMLAVAKGGDPAADKKAERNRGTFEELAARYLEEHAKRHKTWPQADRLVRKHLLPSWAKLQAASITRSDVKSALSRIPHAVLANQVLAAGSAIFSWAVREELLTVNPCRRSSGTRRRPASAFWAMARSPLSGSCSATPELPVAR